MKKESPDFDSDEYLPARVDSERIGDLRGYEHNAPRPEIEEKRLRARKCLVYEIALGSGIVVLLLSWFIRDPGDSFIAVVYPVFAVLFLVLLLSTLFHILPLRPLEVAIYSVASSLVLARLVWHFHIGGPIEEHLLQLAGGHYWAVGVLVVAGFVMFDRHRGLVAGTLVLLVSVGIAASGLYGGGQVGSVDANALRYLLRVHIFLVILLVLASAQTFVHHMHQRAVMRAEVLSQWANVDWLTGIANRRAVDRFLGLQISAAGRHGRPLSVIIADIDEFKVINDTRGHAVGDDVLVGFTQRLKATLRESDFLARWGGEEFLIVAPDTRANDAESLAERCRAAIVSEPIAGVQVTATFGVTEFVSGDSIESLTARADARLYEGKRTGRNRVVVERGR